MTTAAAPTPNAVPSSGADPTVSVVIVSYNTRDVLEGCLRALLDSSGVSFEIFVVDNGSLDGSADLVSERFPSVHLLRNPDNRGFAAANNVAIVRSRGRYIMLLNPDTLVRPRTVALLAAFLDACPDIGITGPRVLNGDGTLQSCGYWYPTLLSEIRLSRTINRWLRFVLGDARPDPDPTRPTEVDWVDGCCLMVRRTLIEQIGLLDEQYFLYAEELDWCRTARAADWQIVTCPSSEMVHLRAQSTEQVKAPALSLLVETRLRYYRKHDGWVTAWLVALVYVAGCLRRWSFEPDKCRAKLQGVRQWWRRSSAHQSPAAPQPALPAAVAAPGRRDGP